VQLRDGRQLKVPVTVEPPRPQVTLLSKGTQDESSAALAGAPGQRGRPARLTTGGWSSFSSRACRQNFPRDEKVEVAAVDGSFRTVLSLADGSLMLEDAKTAMGTLDPLARFGSSAFGPVQARAMSPMGLRRLAAAGNAGAAAGIQGTALPACRCQALHADGNESFPGCVDRRADAGLRQRHRCAAGVSPGTAS
jgi:hypothetical protein